MVVRIFFTSSYEYMKAAICPEGRNAGSLARRTFPDGERYMKVLSDIAGSEAVIVGGTINDSETLELYDLACALVKYGATKLTIAIPFFGYSTMERAVAMGEVVTAKTRARLLSSIPIAPNGNSVIMFDIHSESIPHYFEGMTRARNVRLTPLVKELITWGFNSCGQGVFNATEGFVLGSTDAGRAKWIESLAKEMNIQPAFAYKRRLSGDRTEVSGVNADVAGKAVVIYDDMIRSGSSLLSAAKAYREAGATKIAAVCTHGLFVHEGLKKIFESDLICALGCTNTHPWSYRLFGQDENNPIETLVQKSGRNWSRMVKPVEDSMVRAIYA